MLLFRKKVESFFWFADFWILVRVSLIKPIRETLTKIQKSANFEKKSKTKIATTFFLGTRSQKFLVLIISTLSDTFIFSLFMIIEEDWSTLRHPYIWWFSGNDLRCATDGIWVIFVRNLSKTVSTFFRKSKISSRKMKKCRSIFF